jgi:hypothetical protein
MKIKYIGSTTKSEGTTKNEGSTKSEHTTSNEIDTGASNKNIYRGY